MNNSKLIISVRYEGMLRACYTARRNKKKTADDQHKFVSGSRGHVGANERTWTPFSWPISLVK